MGIYKINPVLFLFVFCLLVVTKKYSKETRKFILDTWNFNFEIMYFLYNYNYYFSSFFIIFLNSTVFDRTLCFNVQCGRMNYCSWFWLFYNVGSTRFPASWCKENISKQKQRTNNECCKHNPTRMVQTFIYKDI